MSEKDRGGKEMYEITVPMYICTIYVCVCILEFPKENSIIF